MKIITLILLMMSGWVSAASIEYYGTPVFYGKYSPDKVTCTYDRDSRYGFCGDDSAPIEGKVGVTNPNEPGHGVGVTVALFTELVCLEGICKSNYGEPLGEIGLKGTSYWTIPTGYYLSDRNGSYMAYKHGKGPLAKKYRMHTVYALPGYNDPANGIMIAATKGYDIHCNTVGECSYLGIDLKQSGLIKYIPKVLTYNCDVQFCYNPDLTVAGLNPKGI